MKRNRTPSKVNAKKICSSDNDKNDNRPSNGEKEQVRVYCRVRPLHNENEMSCMKVIPPNIVQVTAPEVNRNGIFKEIQYTFKEVFDEKTSQETVFKSTGLGLVKNLIEGKNGLLLAYGISGSGKSFTMNGNQENEGIMPRCLDVLFNSISDYQTKKYIFKPDKLNGFDVQSEVDAVLERQRELISAIKMPKLRKKDSDPDLARKSDLSIKLNNVVKDNSYAVFVTYVEIYNNNVFDLMEEIPEDGTRQRPPQPKLIREDGSRNMYVHGVNEVEVKSSEEAFDVFYKGQKRRRLAHTALNTESSRSHSVFTIRLVQGPLNVAGDAVIQDRKKLCISQLSLVDLAGSERTSRAKTAGQRLREAGNINNSLMSLRTCLEILRENQQNGTNKIVPYRDSRLTHYFKNYFDGEGCVRMIVCVNPKADCFDETLHVLKFSEMSQEVQVTRPAPVKLDPGLTPGRRKLMRQGVLKQEELNRDIPETQPIRVDFHFNYRVAPLFPDVEMMDPENDKPLKDLMACIEFRMQDAAVTGEQITKTGESFRNKLIQVESGYLGGQDELRRLATSLNKEKSKNEDLEKKLGDLDSINSQLHIKLIGSERAVRNLENEMADKQLQLTRVQTEYTREKCRYKNLLQMKQDKLTKEMEQKLKNQRSAMELEMWEKDRKLERVKRVLDGPSSCTAILHSAPRPQTASSASSSTKENNYPITPSVFTARRRFFQQADTPHTTKSVETLDLATPASTVNQRRGRTATAATAVAPSSARHRRSKSAGGDDHWLDHRPLESLPLNSIMQPVIKKRKSVTKLTDVKDVANAKTSKYCLTTQTVDSEGDQEICLYKADVTQTIGGGAKVTFNDIEVLQHKSPVTSPAKKRPTPVCSPRAAMEVEDRCAISLEGHSSRT